MARLNTTMNYESSIQENNPLRYSVVNIFSTEGRIGGQAYFVYSIILPFTLFLIFGSIAGLVSTLSSTIGNLATIVSYAILTLSAVVILLTLVRLTIQRCHDFNANAAWGLLALIPFANIVFSLIPGDNGLNSYGESPERPSMFIKTGVIVIIGLALALTAFFIMQTLGVNLRIYSLNFSLNL